MADMIPESISTNSMATPGEKRVFKLLREALLPDEDYIVWYEPKPLDRFTDFVVWSQYDGLMVVEVKDWRISQIKHTNPQQFKGTFYGNVETNEMNPLRQARDVANQLKTQLSKIPSFIHPEGELKNKLKFPIGHSVIFTNITRNQAQTRGMLNNQILGENQALFNDDLNFDPDDKTERRDFIAKIKQAFTVKFGFDPLNYGDIKALRYALFPEVRVNVSQIRKLRTAKDEEMLKTLDLSQEQTAKSLGEGHRILKGVAGSGKSLVLACRAKYLRQLHPDWRLLVVCYNISLRQYLKELIRISGHKHAEENIDIYHFHGLVKELTNANLSRVNAEKNDDYDKRVGEILKGRIAMGTVNKGIYNAILVDEGQDFTTEWVQGLSSLLNENSDSFLFCYDPAQNVFGRKKPNWKTAGLKVQGKKPTELKKSYRNTIEILDVATRFSKMKKVVLSYDNEDAIDNVLFPELAIDRHGSLPILQQSNSSEEQIHYILNDINDKISSKEVVWSDIGVIVATADTNKELQSSFEREFINKFGSDKLYWATRDRNAKINLDIFSPTVKLLTVESSKGLEFRIVFFLGVDNMPRIGREEDSERKLVYVGMTRAQDLLYILFRNRNNFINEIEDAVRNVGTEVGTSKG